MAKLSPLGPFRAFDSTGAPLLGGKLYTYEAGTSTPKTTYTDADEGTPNLNPIILDSEGYADVWLDEGSYKLVLDDSSDVEQWSVDNVTGDTSTAFGSSVVSQSSNLTVTNAYNNNIFICTDTFTFTLLPAADADAGFYIVVTNKGTGDITIDPDSSETINSTTTLVLKPGQSAIVSTDNSEWWSILDFTGTVNFSGAINEAKGDDITSAASIDLGAATGNLVHITGTTGITSLGTPTGVAAGASRTTVTDNILTFTHSASLICITSDNITTAAGDIQEWRYEGSGVWRMVGYQRADGNSLQATIVPFSHLGVTISNGTDTDHDIDFSAGTVADSTSVANLTLAAMTKQLDAIWAAGDDAGGLFSGTIAADTVYHCFVIESDDGTTIDAGFDTSITAANIPSGYTRYRRVGSIITDSSSNILTFYQAGNRFALTTKPLDINDTTPSTGSRTLYPLTVPTGISVLANVRFVFSNSVSSQMLITSPSDDDVAPSALYYTMYDLGSTDIGEASGVWLTDTSAQIGGRSTDASVSAFRGWVEHWEDYELLNGN